jgi:aminoglycoside 6'-N-acetyltransferase
MREYERGPDGTWHDGLMMDLLAAELRTRDVSQT